MGNSKSRHANSGSSNRKHTKHNSSHSIDPRNQQHLNGYYNNYNHGLSTDAFPTHLAPNDSGHYSTHGSMAPVNKPDFPGGSFHQNLSSPGRLDLQKEPSDSSLQLQYGTRTKRIQQQQNQGQSNGNSIIPTSNTNAANNINNGPIRNSRAGINPYSNIPPADQLPSNFNNGYSSHDLVPPQMLENDARPTSARYSHGRISSLGQSYNPHQQQYSTNTSTAFQSPHMQYQQYQRISTASPTPINGLREDDSRVQPMLPYSPVINDGINSVRHGHVSMQSNTRYPPQQQQQDYVDSPYQQRTPSHQFNGMPNPSAGASPVPQGRPTMTDTRATRNSNGPTGGAPRAAEVFQNVGPLVNLDAPSSSSSSRPLAADQVFARLARQNPTNPRESDKRERIFKWRDNTVKALTFNPDTSVPNWIIPVIPDELDKTDSIFYLDRITYELDLIAPVGRPFRKAIDINCASGAWAMDLSLKHPRTIVYAIDPSLSAMHLPRQIPENCRFKIRDLKEQEGEFDLVHQRLGAYRIHIQEWTPHFAELSRLTKAGGWIQLAECNGMIVSRGGLESLKVNTWVEKAAMSSGLNPMQIVDALIPTILGAGLINVECYEYGIPLGEWGGQRGLIAMRTYLDIVESLRDEIIEMNRLEEGIFEETIELMKMECSAEYAQLIMKVICAQKPPITDDIWRQS